jgi:hypothetical protein
VPADNDSKQPEPRAQVARNQFHRGDIAGMAGDKDEFANPGSRHALAKLGPCRDRGGGRECERAGIGEVLSRNADALRRQERDRQVRRQIVPHPPQVGFGNERIDAERQMRPVLLDGCERQHGDPARR